MYVIRLTCIDSAILLVGGNILVFLQSVDMTSLRTDDGRSNSVTLLSFLHSFIILK